MADPLATPGAESIELHDLTPGVESDIDNSNPGIAALPRADGGRQAYQFLAACFVLEATVWGVSSALSHSFHGRSLTMAVSALLRRLPDILLHA